MLDEHQLPFGQKERKDTDFERINPQSANIVTKMATYKRRIAGVMMPRDLEEIRKIENKLQLSKHDIALKQEYDQCLKRCVCVELIQIKDFIQI